LDIQREEAGSSFAFSKICATELHLSEEGLQGSGSRATPAESRLAVAVDSRSGVLVSTGEEVLGKKAPDNKHLADDFDIDTDIVKLSTVARAVEVPQEVLDVKPNLLLQGVTIERAEIPRILVAG